MLFCEVSQLFDAAITVTMMKVNYKVTANRNPTYP